MRRTERGWLAAERQREVVRLIVDEHLTFQQAGERMGVSKQRAHELFQQAKRATASDGVPQWRDDGVKFADQMIAELLVKARDPATHVRELANIYKTIMNFEEHKARLLGTYSPQMKQITTITSDTLEQAVRMAQAELAQLERPHTQYQVIKELS